MFKKSQQIIQLSTIDTLLAQEVAIPQIRNQTNVFGEEEERIPPVLLYNKVSIISIINTAY